MASDLRVTVAARIRPEDDKALRKLAARKGVTLSAYLAEMVHRSVRRSAARSNQR